MIDLTPLANEIISLVAAVIAAFLIPLLWHRFGNERLKKIMAVVAIAVKAAEECFSKPGSGDKKRTYVQKFLQQKGFDLDEEEVDAYINSTVWELINRFKDKQPEITGGAEGTE